MKKIEIYNSIINKLNDFEGNSHYDDILLENNNDLEYSIYNLGLIINRIIKSLFDNEIEEKEFYIDILKELKSI